MNYHRHRNAFVLEFVLELRNERLCNGKKSQIASVDTPALAQPPCLTIIAPTLFPHVTRAIAESPVSTFVAIATTLSSGSMSEMAKRRRANFRFGTATINRS